MMLSDQGCDEEDQGEESGDVGFEEQIADDVLSVVGGDVLGDGLAGEGEYDEEGDQDILHVINNE